VVLPLAALLIGANVAGGRRAERRGEQAEADELARQQAIADAEQRQRNADAHATMRLYEGGNALPLLQSPNDEVRDFARDHLVAQQQRRQGFADDERARVLEDFDARPENMNPVELLDYQQRLQDFQQGQFNLDRDQLFLPGEYALQQLALDQANSTPQQPFDPTKPHIVSNAYRPTVDAAGNPNPRLEYHFLPGTPQQLKSQADADEAKNMLGLVNEMRSLIALEGTEQWNDETLGQMRSLHVEILQRMAVLTGAGALGEQEREAFERGFGDPTSWSPGSLLGTKADYFQSQYDSLAKRVSNTYYDRLAANPWNYGDLMMLHPDTISMETREYINAAKPDLMKFSQAQQFIGQ
jgi:hypothetical protein